jgi:hypothetical protein
LTLPKFPRSPNARKWLWIGIAAFAALQLYFVQEMIAALLIFSALFAVVAGVALILFLLDVASQRTLTWAEPQTKLAARYARTRGALLVSSVERASHEAAVWAAPRAKHAGQYSRAKGAQLLLSVERASREAAVWTAPRAKHAGQYSRDKRTQLLLSLDRGTERTIAWAKPRARHAGQYVRRWLALIEETVEKWTPSGKAHS